MWYCFFYSIIFWDLTLLSAVNYNNSEVIMSIVEIQFGQFFQSLAKILFKFLLFFLKVYCLVLDFHYLYVHLTLIVKSKQDIILNSSYAEFKTWWCTSSHFFKFLKIFLSGSISWFTLLLMYLLLDSTHNPCERY